MKTQHHRRPALATVQGRPATQAERDAIAFKPISVTRLTNEEWTQYLKSIHFASAVLADDHEELKRKFERLTSSGHAGLLLDNLCMAKGDLGVLVKLLDTAIARSFLILERLGYSPDNPPA